MVGLVQPMPKRKISLGEKKPARPSTRSNQKQRESILRSNKVKMLRGEGNHATQGRKQKEEAARRMLERMNDDEGEEFVRMKEEQRRKQRE
ncbi:unnamed protein product [Microthlaspi erraticum]|uniref:Uncharacterized protein n=1 Tax=Microthlaspi erraticum TaxID=1685480 RepID=A0A6D2KDW6_9BRAS|nr:unnamed protein product [Microthlaspi erraticum]